VVFTDLTKAGSTQC